jgi:NADH:ubiquinone reductase (H+-translocating)
LGELRGRGIDIRLGTTLEEVGPDSARLSTGETLPTRTVVWTAGVAPNPTLRQLSVPLDDRGRVPVDDHLRVRGMDSVWAIGDCAATPHPTRAGAFYAPTAQNAVRQGPVAARNIAAELGNGKPEAFDYRGNAAFVNLGRYKAVGRVGGRTFRGFPAWWLARSYHMSQIPGAARKARAVIDWTASLPFRRDLSEVGSIGHPKPLGETMEPWDSSISSSPSSSASPRR